MGSDLWPRPSVEKALGMGGPQESPHPKGGQGATKVKFPVLPSAVPSPVVSES